MTRGPHRRCSLNYLIGEFIVNHYATRLLLRRAEGDRLTLSHLAKHSLGKADPEKDFSVSAQKSVLRTLMANLWRRYHSLGKDF
jgi:hypothetical protein